LAERGGQIGSGGAMVGRGIMRGGGVVDRGVMVGGDAAVGDNCT